MLGSIEKGRKLPQFGRRHTVTFFNKMYPLSWLARCGPIEHFIVFCHLALPAREGSWHCVPEVTKSLCVPTLVFTFLRGFEGRAALLFFSSCHKWSLTGAQRVWARTSWFLLEVPHALGIEGRRGVCLKSASDCPQAQAEKGHFSGDKHPSMTGMEVLLGGRTKLGEHNDRSQKPLYTSASVQGLHWFPWHSSQWSGQFL